jgi:hypothetical protein
LLFFNLKFIKLTEQTWGIGVSLGNFINLCFLNTDNSLSAPKSSVLFGGNGYRRLCWDFLMEKTPNTGNKGK